jgi:DNA-binding CsgD family transcriptional regulator
MRNRSAALALEVAEQAPPSPAAANVRRALLELVERLNKEAEETGPVSQPQAEEILLDSEVNGSRYLLLRMPRVNRARIQLSPREQEIVRMVAKGHPNKVIADVLNISCWTVCTHLRRIFAKLGVGSRAAMVAQLVELSAITLDHWNLRDER